MAPFKRARLLALIVPAGLMAGAWGSQYIGGLHPCEMCMWQRWPHEIAIVLALLAFVFRKAVVGRLMIALAAFAIMTSGAIGLFHAGVEYGWWEGLTRCAVTSTTVTLESIMNAPVIRCDTAPWSFLGISLAGFNAIISLLGGLAVLAWLWKDKGDETA